MRWSPTRASRSRRRRSTTPPGSSLRSLGTRRRKDMARPVTLFTGQWADLTLEDLAAKVGEWEFDGLELACWGDHFDVAQALSDSSYIAGRREILERNNLNVWAIGNHLVGQCVCDPIDSRHAG